MKILRYRIYLFYLCAVYASMTSAGSEYEQLIANTLRATISDAVLLNLSTGEESFMGVYQAVLEGPVKGAVLIIHSMGGHPDWPQLISPLRTYLPTAGWSSLAIQMPVLSPTEPFSHYGRSFAQANKRIDAAAQHLLTRQQNTIIIGYGFGAALAAHYLATRKNEKIKGFIAISPQAQAFLKPRFNLLDALKKIQIPVLDIYGSRDFDAIIAQADDRRLAGRASGGRHYDQRMLKGADYYYTSMEEHLFKQIRAWLDTSMQADLSP